jgi:hypothetical protein
VETPDSLLARREDLVAVLDDRIRRQATPRFAKVHRATTGMKPEPHPPRDLDLDREEIPDATGEDVVVVGRGSATGEG